MRNHQGGIREMNEPLRVLIVEDSEVDAELLLLQLRRGGYAPVSERVDTPESMKEALDKKVWDIVISDYTMPHFDGIAALKLFQESRLDIPFILVSGTIGEEIAVEAMKAGAHDYLMKDKLARLVPAIKRELQEAEVRRERRRVMEKNKHLTAVLHAIRNVNQLIVKEKNRDRLLEETCKNLVKTRGFFNAWIALMDDAKNFVRFSEAGLGEEFRLIEEQMKRGELPKCVQEAVVQEGVVVIEDPCTTCTGCPLKDSYRGKDGMYTRLEHDGRIYGVLTVSIPRGLGTYAEEQSLFQEVAEDIAFALHDMELEEKRKKAQKALEESEHKYRTLVEEAEDGVYILLDKRFVYVNDAFCRLFGYSREEIEQIDDFMKLVVKERVFFGKHRAERIENGEKRSSMYEFTGKTKAGKNVYLRGNVTPIVYKGTPARQGIIRDITLIKEHEKQLLHVITNTSHLINTPLTVALGQMELVEMGAKEVTRELATLIHKKLLNIRELVIDGLIKNVNLLIVETSDGWTPVKRRREP